MILQKLFPSQNPESLLHLSKEDLLHLTQDPSSLPSEQQGFAADHDQDSDADSDDREWNEPQNAADPEEAQCDDVNGLSLTIQRRSYMGNSSILAVFRAMFKIKPSLQQELKNRIQFYDNERLAASPGTAQTQTTPSDYELKHRIPSVGERPSIDAYFAHIQGIVPILDEVEFRDTWARGLRNDRPWLALLNMVFVLGSLAVGDSDESSSIYYARAKDYLDLELLGIGCMESLQALCLLGGVYLHYKNSPNMAYSIMGASTRIAIGLGLHRQPGTTNPVIQDATQGGGKRQIRRRVWWSLFCLDAWGSTTLGRPTLGRWDPQTMDVPVANAAEKIDLYELSLDSARAFCTIATRVQHRLATLSPMTTKDINDLDAEVLNWYHNLPHDFVQLENCPANFVTGQDIMRNRYFNLRLLLHRPILLRYATAKFNINLALSPVEYESIQKCRDIACEAIDRVASARNSVNRIRAWSSVWYLYQSSMVLLLSILVDGEHPQSSRWRVSVERAIRFFEFADLLTASAARSRKVIRSLLDACTGMPLPLNPSPSSGGFQQGDAGFPMANRSTWTELGLDSLTEQPEVWDMAYWPTELGDAIDWSTMSSAGPGM